VRNILAIDIGGNTVKVLISGGTEPRSFPSGPTLTARQMADGVLKLTEDWDFDAVSIGYPGRVRDHKIIAEPVNLGSGWVNFDFQKAFGVPVKILNDAAMQAIGSYKGGKMLFLGLGTGLGTALVVDGALLPMELGHMPYKNGTYESLLGLKGLTRLGIKKWRDAVFEVVALCINIFELDEVVIGGGNINKLDKIPPGSRPGDNALAFAGGFLLWEQERTRGSRRSRAGR
jgi:polyphosphate glucokinase